jgi:hypothetical protein
MVFPPLAVKHWIIPTSEATLYIGLLPLGIAFAGLFSKSGKLRLNFTLTLALVLFLGLSHDMTSTALGKTLFPFLRYARHMQLFQPFFIFFLMYFVGQGSDRLVEWSRKHG